MNPLFKKREHERTIEIFRAAYPESGQYNQQILEIKKRDIPALIEALNSEGEKVHPEDWDINVVDPGSFRIS